MYLKNDVGIEMQSLYGAVEKSLEDKSIKKVLILPPDYTRMYSGAGILTKMYYDCLKDRCTVDIMPALGTHEPMTRGECEAFFGKDVPFEKILGSQLAQ